jgi:hypothetical protein
MERSYDRFHQLILAGSHYHCHDVVPPLPDAEVGISNLL